MNALGDDYVSFTAMDISCSPDDKLLLVSTGINRFVRAVYCKIPLNVIYRRTGIEAGLPLLSAIVPRGRKTSRGNKFVKL